MSRWSRILTVCLPAILAFSALHPSSPAQQLAKRLILKDGSYQLISKYEVHGDRVHYYSAEREEWEDVPTTMVDWDATAKYEKDRAAGLPAPEALQLDKEIAEEQKAEETKNPEVAPGLRLPEDGEIFLLDTFRTQPQLIALQQNDASLDRNTKRNVLRAAVNPIASSTQNLELSGPHAKIQSHVPLPSFYVNAQNLFGEIVSTKTKTGPPDVADHFKILRLQPKPDRRIVAQFKIAVYGKTSQQQIQVPAKVEPLTGGWTKITPSNDLSIGEYALVEVNDESRDPIGAIWDFGINPDAAANTGLVISPATKPAAKTGPPNF